MSTSITLKNIPDDLYARLKNSAQLYRRSLNSEVLVWLETMMRSTPAGEDTHLARAQALRAALPEMAALQSDIEAFKHEGRA